MSFSYSKSCCSSLWCLVSQKKSNFLAAFDVDLKEEKEVSLLMLFLLFFPYFSLLSSECNWPSPCQPIHSQIMDSLFSKGMWAILCLRERLYLPRICLPRNWTGWAKGAKLWPFPEKYLWFGSLQWATFSATSCHRLLWDQSQRQLLWHCWPRQNWHQWCWDTL